MKVAQNVPSTALKTFKKSFFFKLISFFAWWKKMNEKKKNVGIS